MAQQLLFGVSLLLFLYLAGGTAYLFLLACAGRFGKKPLFPSYPSKKKMLLLIPSYKEDNIIVDTARKAYQHNYPRGHFQVLVIADKLQPQTVQQLKDIPVEVLEVDQDMKSRSIHQAITQKSDGEFDLAVILDADNVMGDGCLEKINSAFQQGDQAVQCHRTAKNKQTTVALLDAISEEINVNLFRRGPARLHLSAAPIGSGMAFGFSLLRDIFSTDEILQNPGEDREIDVQLMKRGIAMEFIDEAFVYDEKVANARVFEKQRIRWLEAQAHHVRRLFYPDLKQVPKTKIYYHKLVQNLLLPRVLFLLVFSGLFVVLLAQWYFRVALLFPGPLWWLGCMGVFALTLAISIPAKYYSLRTLQALLYVPILMVSMVKALFKMKKNRKEFLHTPKSFHPD
jgi:cellulose synthase/poly-beta-1,6-N-acetylglucosamine synthase-like glycosyltransferase